MRNVKLNQLSAVLDELEYPVTTSAVRSEFDDVVLDLADGQVPMTRVLEPSMGGPFETADDLSSEVMSLLPRRAVGEPFQSDGDA